MILHISFEPEFSIDGNFYLWIEKPLLNTKKRKISKGRNKLNYPAHILPRSELLQVVKKFRTLGFNEKMEVKNNYLWLPSFQNKTSSAPIPSPDLLKILEDKEKLLPNCWIQWKIPTIIISQNSLFQLLFWLFKQEKRIEKINVIYGSSIRVLLKIFQWTLSQISEKRVQPYVLEEIRSKDVHFSLIIQPLKDQYYNDLVKQIPSLLFIARAKSPNLDMIREDYFRSQLSEKILIRLVQNFEKINCYYTDPNVWKISEKIFDGWAKNLFGHRVFELKYIAENILKEWAKSLFGHLGSEYWSELIEERYASNNRTKPETKKIFHNVLKIILNWTGQNSKIITDDFFGLGFIVYEPNNQNLYDNPDQININSLKKRDNSQDWTLEVVLCNYPEKIYQKPTEILPLSEIYINDIDSTFLREILIQLMIKSLDFSPLKRFFINPVPKKISMTQAEMFEFLENIKPQLESSGFYVQSPDWWNDNTLDLALIMDLDFDERFGTKDKLNDEESFSIGNAIFSFNWKIAIGDLQFSTEEFKVLLKRNAKLLHLGEKWVKMPNIKRKDFLDLLKRTQDENKIDLGKALRMALAKERVPEGFQIIGLESKGTLKKVLENLLNNRELESIDCPSDFQGVLRPYQMKGLAWLGFLYKMYLGACLADDMGLGKTIQIIALILHLKLQKNSDALPTSNNPHLLFCPLSLVGNWEYEIHKFAPTLKILIHQGSNRTNQTEIKQKIKNVDLFITSYSLAYRDFEILQQIQWESLILDEAQYIKNWNTKRTQAINKLNGFHRIALTGTPIENHLSELWSIMEFLNPGYLGTKSEFQTQFEKPIMQEQDENASDILKRLIQPFILRRLKTDKKIIKDLPEKTETNYYSNLTPKQASLYQSIINQMLPKIDSSNGIKRKGFVLSAITKLKQICDHPNIVMKTTDFNDIHEIIKTSGKLEQLIDIIEKILDNDEKAIIFTQYVQAGKIVEEVLNKKFNQKAFFVYGDTPLKIRKKIFSTFQISELGVAENGNINEADENNVMIRPSNNQINLKDDLSILILSLKTGGLGLNLTAANHVIHFDRWWNPAVENQATDRAHRIGQNRHVQVYKLICTGTLEEYIDKMLEQKKNLADAFIDSGDSWITELTTQQLKEVIELRNDYIDDFA